MRCMIVGQGQNKDNLDLFQKKTTINYDFRLRHYMIHNNNMLLIICLTKTPWGSIRELGHFYKLFSIVEHNIT